MRGTFVKILPPPEGKQCSLVVIETERGTERCYLSLGNMEAIEIGAIKLQPGEEIALLGSLAQQQVWLKRNDTWYRPL